MIHSCCPFRTLYILTCLIVVTHSYKLILIIGRNCCSSFVSTWIHIQFFMRSVLLILYVFCVVFCLSSLGVLCWPMLLVSLDCQFSIVPSAFTHIIYTDVSCGYGAVAYFSTLQCFVLTLDISFMIDSLGLWALALHQSLRTQMLLYTCLSFMTNQLLYPPIRPLQYCFCV